MVDEAQGSWGLITTDSQPADIFLKTFFSLSIPTHRLAHMLCTRHKLHFVLPPMHPPVCHSLDGHLSTLPSYFCPYWTSKYHNWGRSWAEVNEWLDGPAPCFHLKKDLLSVFLKHEPLVGTLKNAFSSPSLFCLLRKLLGQDKTSVHITCWADASEPFGLSCRYEVAAGDTCFYLSTRRKVNIFYVDSRFLRKSVASRRLWTAVASSD